MTTFKVKETVFSVDLFFLPLLLQNLSWTSTEGLQFFFLTQGSISELLLMVFIKVSSADLEKQSVLLKVPLPIIFTEMGATATEM